MDSDRTTATASVIVVVTGAVWGLYWLPVRRLADAGLPGAWGSLAAAAIAVILLAPAVLRRRAFQGDRRTMLFTALGGASFLLYSVALVYGRVAIIILLFYLTPVWSTLIGRVVLGWRSRPSRILAIVLGLAGLVVMLGAEGDLPVPRNVGEWLALAAGLLWSIASIGIRTGGSLAVREAGFVFSLGACAGAVVLLPFLSPLPQAVAVGPAIGWSFAAGGLWWAASISALMWATARLEPTRVGILLMSEVVVGALSGAWLAGERLGPVELAGGALVLVAAAIEICRPPRAARVPD